MTRKQLVEALRVLHEGDEVTKIVTRAKRIDISFRSKDRDGLLVIPIQNNEKLPKLRETIPPKKLGT